MGILDEKRFGLKTLIWYLISKTIFGFFLLFLGLNFPPIIRLIISATKIIVSQEYVKTLNLTLGAATAVVISLGLIAIFLGIISSIIKYFGTTYTITDYSIRLRHGLIARNEISIPYKSIEDVDLDQSILFRFLGLCHLIILSAGTDDEVDKTDGTGVRSSQIFHMIDSDIAIKLREFLLKKSSVQETQEVNKII